MESRLPSGWAGVWRRHIGRGPWCHDLLAYGWAMTARPRPS